MKRLLLAVTSAVLVSLFVIPAAPASADVCVRPGSAYCL